MKLDLLHRLSVFENSLLKRIYGHKRDEVTGDWRKLHSKEKKGKAIPATGRGSP
jgi:hypothetical protein